MNSACTPATTRSFEINIADGDGPLLPRVHQDGLSIRAELILVAITASCGLAWIVMSSVTLPSDLTWVGEFKRNFRPPGGSSNLSRQIIYSSASITDFDAGLAVGRTVPETGRAANVGDGLKHHPSPASSRAKRSVGVATPSASAIDHSQALQQHAASIRPSVNDLNNRAKLTPIPETRPTTIEGWTLREVTNGIAILEGPNGIWRVRRGETVPGVGRVDSILLWGERWIVATSRGLISTS
jgi:hypothetical protein